MKWILIAVGGGLGSVLRYGVQGAVQRAAGADFPAGTLAVNIIGCLLIGCLAALFNSPLMVREEYRIGMTVGLLGGFTTFSAFGLESFLLAGDGQWRSAALNVIVSCLGGLLAVWIGFRVVERIFGIAS